MTLFRRVLPIRKSSAALSLKSFFILCNCLYSLLWLCVCLSVFGSVTAIDVNYSTDEPDLLLLLCSHSLNDVPPEPQRNVSIAAVRGAVRPSKEPEV